MAGFLRSKQAGIQNDISASIRPELFTPDDQARYGINSQVRYVARHVGVVVRLTSVCVKAASATTRSSRSSP